MLTFTAYAWRLFLAMLVWMVRTMSGLIGAVNTAGRVVCSAASPLSTLMTLCTEGGWENAHAIRLIVVACVRLGVGTYG